MADAENDIQKRAYSLTFGFATKQQRACEQAARTELGGRGRICASPTGV
jgi:hypothetical protein